MGIFTVNTKTKCFVAPQEEILNTVM